MKVETAAPGGPLGTLRARLLPWPRAWQHVATVALALLAHQLLWSLLGAVSGAVGLLAVGVLSLVRGRRGGIESAVAVGVVLGAATLVRADAVLAPVADVAVWFATYVLLGAVLGGLIDREQHLRSQLVSRRHEKAISDEQAAALRHLVSSMPAIVFTTDSALRFTMSVGAGLRSLGLEPNQIVGVAVRDYLGFTEEGEDAYQAVLDAFNGTERSKTLQFADRIFESYFAPTRDEEGRITGVVGVSIDVTERVESERELEEDLEKERQAVARLRELDEMKTAFLQAVSHELRTPLTSLRGFATTLARSYDRLSDEQRQLLFERLEHNSGRLQRLLTDLLDVDRLSRGVIEPRRRMVDLSGMVLRLVDETDFGSRPVRVFTDDVTAHVDGAQVERIVENLLVNAVRHTPEGTRLRVRVGRVDAASLIVVEQDGAGVSDDLKDVIFEPFRQGPTTRSHSPGTGIGLSLVARLADMHGGRAWVEDLPNGGAAFHVLLPDGDRRQPQQHERNGVARPTVDPADVRVHAPSASE